jgi:hypothetical protein
MEIPEEFFWSLTLSSSIKMFQLWHISKVSNVPSGKESYSITYLSVEDFKEVFTFSTF